MLCRSSNKNVELYFKGNVFQSVKVMWAILLITLKFNLCNLIKIIKQAHLKFLINILSFDTVQ